MLAATEIKTGGSVNVYKGNEATIRGEMEGNSPDEVLSNLQRSNHKKENVTTEPPLAAGEARGPWPLH
jgi:hypothetical protein